MTLADRTARPVASATPSAAPPARRVDPLGGGRLQFLDALRGVAALAVALQHFAEMLWEDYFRFSLEVIRPGEFGVVLFFLCSGFIIPASMEKRGSLREFWTGRVFRLFPLYLLCLVAALALGVAGLYPLPEAYLERPVVATLANTTMLQQFLDQPLALGQSWSLAYEMVFYFAVSVLFLARLHTRSVPVALLVLAAVVAVGTRVPPLVISDGSDRWLTAAGVATAVAVAAVVAVVRGGLLRRAAAGVFTAAVVPLVLNQPGPLWFALLLFASMAVGTVLYRATTGETSGPVAAGVLAAAGGVMALVTWWHVEPHPGPADTVLTAWPEIATFAAAYLVFGVALLARHRLVPPRWLVWLGTVSYSVYLVHALVLYAVPWWGDSKPLTFLRWLVITLVVSGLTYRWVERPAIDLGRRWTRRRRELARQF